MNPYSQRYTEQIDLLASWFFERLTTRPPINITPDQRQRGVDAIPEVKDWVDEAFQLWLSRGYELSYNQMNAGFFKAHNSVGSEPDCFEQLESGEWTFRPNLAWVPEPDKVWAFTPGSFD